MCLIVSLDSLAYHIQVPPYCGPLPQCGGHLLNQGQLSGNDRLLLPAGTVNTFQTWILRPSCPFPLRGESVGLHVAFYLRNLKCIQFLFFLYLFSIVWKQVSVLQGSQLHSRTLKMGGGGLFCVVEVKSKKTDLNKTVPQIVQKQSHMSHLIKY